MNTTSDNIWMIKMLLKCKITIGSEMFFHISATLFQLIGTEKEVDQIAFLQAWKINNCCIYIYPVSTAELGCKYIYLYFLYFSSTKYLYLYFYGSICTCACTCTCTRILVLDIAIYCICQCYMYGKNSIRYQFCILN